jgi:hypothetical protein
VTPKINKNILRQKMALKEIFTFSDLARRIQCSETSLHLAIERPSRFSNVVANIEQILGVELAEITHEPKKDKSQLCV